MSEPPALQPPLASPAQAGAQLPRTSRAMPKLRVGRVRPGPDVVWRRPQGRGEEENYYRKPGERLRTNASCSHRTGAEVAGLDRVRKGAPARQRLRRTALGDRSAAVRLDAITTPQRETRTCHLRFLLAGDRIGAPDAFSSQRTDAPAAFAIMTSAGEALCLPGAPPSQGVPRPCSIWRTRGAIATPDAYSCCPARPHRALQRPPRSRHI